ncbi:MAG: hypothetical protein R3D25_04105 [Geminicoccaceae bacterium]
MVFKRKGKSATGDDEDRQLVADAEDEEGERDPGDAGDRPEDLDHRVEEVAGPGPEAHEEAERDADEGGERVAERQAPEADRCVDEHLAADDQAEELVGDARRLRQDDVIADPERHQPPDDRQRQQRPQIEEHGRLAPLSHRRRAAIGRLRQITLPVVVLALLVALPSTTQ